ncbi:phosphate ABC transporter permease PstA [Oscillatoria salina]|uniref:phosphate ABC transporter permease PstA n=1 Tax=Oscillatoria salina TaxID=331517 RepID=UPI0013BB9F04|nr:phosphate ABC transporter permease PstA [Oscillatoria salina]MBZ8180443.1 phosphate ABC transporter permease PstA [Oscillatoria salina IIICB1]NET89463.1 phosphate ABC transporter permease PstA [Kamptonema sp. SIO1D9]
MTTDKFLENELTQPLSLTRNLFTWGMTAIALIFTAISLLPLLAILFEIVHQGLPQLSWEALTSLPAPAGVEDEPNGFANAIIGTLTMVGIACLISVPLGIMTGVFLAEISQPGDAIAEIVRFIIVILSSVPSIIVGVFAYGVVVLAFGFSALAGGFALGIIMLPIIALTTEQSLKLIPTQYRLASAALGGGRFQTVFRVIIPAALPAITTGVLLAIARAAGETAPLLFTALSSNFWPPLVEQLKMLFNLPEGMDKITVIQGIPETLLTPTPSLSVLIYNYSTSPFKDQNAMAWTAGLVLITLVLITSILSRLVTSKPWQR